MLIRPAELNDCETIASLHADNWRTSYRGILPDDYLQQHVRADRLNDWRQRFAVPPAHQYLVAACDGTKLVGFACAYGAHDPRLGTLLENLHVSADYRGHGIGVLLMAEVAKWSQRHFPADGIHLFALAGNTAARRFYERNGGHVESHGHWQSPAGVAVPELCYSWSTAAALITTAS